MRIEKIILYNFGSYLGENIFDLCSLNSSNGKVVLIGGKNGAGKTTLFSGIKLALYGYRASGYQNLNSHYRKEVKKFFNDAARYDMSENCYVEVSLKMSNGQTEDEYILRRQWNVLSEKLEEFENFSIFKNGIELDEEEQSDFDNYLLNIIPPELFDMFFFDGEQIADYFLGDDGSEKVRNAFMILCGYDTFDIIERNFRRITYGKKGTVVNSTEYLDLRDQKEELERELSKLNEEVSDVQDSIDMYKAGLVKLDKAYRLSGGILQEELNRKLVLLKEEEHFREEQNSLLKKMANEEIPFIIVHNLLQRLERQIEDETDKQKLEILQDSLVRLLPGVLKNVYQKLEWHDDDELTQLVIDEMASEAEKNSSTHTQEILRLSADDSRHLRQMIARYLNISREDVITAEHELKASLVRSQKLREEIDKSHVEGADDYLKERVELTAKIDKGTERRVELSEIIQKKSIELQEVVVLSKRAEKKLDEELKNQSIIDLSQKSVAFLSELQQRLYSSEIEKVERLFMKKIKQLARKTNFIDKILIDSYFNVHIYKNVVYEARQIVKRVNSMGIEKYLQEYGEVHCESILQNTKCSDMPEFVSKYADSSKMIECLQEIEKSRLSKGEKQVFIMSLYWALVQLSNHEVPFVIDTPFARIDTEHRSNITKNFFMDLQGQVFIFSTNEEIVGENYKVISKDIKAKFILENLDNTRTLVTPNKYFGE
ncbi:MAG: AAA family ATPase [Lachnospiraceae bacterium]|nr:AAA family ATPase [Lachnospiraceae bacterium]MCM1192460.1 AAA family ATPase [Acetatifactor muris]